MPSSDRVLKGPRTGGPPAAPADPVPGQRPGLGRVLGSEGGTVHPQGPATPASPASLPRSDANTRVELTSEIQRVVREAERRGYEAGRARGEAELAGAIAAAATLATVLEDAAPRQAPVVAALVAEIAIAVAARILDAEVTLDPGLLKGALERAMEGVNGSPEVRVLLHPAAVTAVREAWIAAHGPAFAGKKWSFDADSTLPIGGCVVRHDHGFVDAGLEAQLAEVAAAMDKIIPLVGRTQDVAA